MLKACAPQYMEAEALAVNLQALLPIANNAGEKGTAPKFCTIIIIDVRDPEEIQTTGFIKSSIHIPSDNFADDEEADIQVSTILQHAESAAKPCYIFHCAFSQQRGPFCAARFISRCAAQDQTPAVFILKGGFNNWKRLSQESELVSSFTMPAT